MQEEEFTFILSAIEFVATYGQRFLSLYSFDWVTGNWTFRRAAFKYHLLKEDHDLITVHDLHKKSKTSEKNEMRKVFHDYLEWAMKIALSLDESSSSFGIPEDIDSSLILFRV
jgi:hypothetical protein